MQERVRWAVPAIGSEGCSVIAARMQAARQADGGFSGRAGASDLYYSVFAAGILRAVDDPDTIRTQPAYLAAQGDGAECDLVHLACLARLRAEAGLDDPVVTQAIAAQLHGYAYPAGGFSQTPNPDHATAYGSYLAFAAYQDLGLELPDRDGLMAAIEGCRSSDGAYANEPDQEHGLTAITAGIVALRCHCGLPIEAATRDWIMARAHRQGGFMASPLVPVPDLLSTATALTALAHLEADLGPLTQPCLMFLDALWDSRGGFRPHAFESAVDSEYTWYGMLCLGILLGPDPEHQAPT